MKLADLRKLTIKKQLRISFLLRNGMECVIDEHGLAQVPALRRVPDFNLEQELASAGEFSVEPVKSPVKKAPPAPQAIAREQLSAMAAAAAGPTAVGHEEE
jgi:hypothetical protein